MAKNYTISSQENVTLITFHTLPSDLQLVAHIFEEFARRDLNIDMISQTAPFSGILNISFTTQSERLRDILEITGVFSKEYTQIKPLVNSGNCKITISGDLMKTTCGVAARVFSLLGEENIDVLLVTTAETEISLLVPQTQLFQVQNLLEENL